jgi:hypothetical protein
MSFNITSWSKRDRDFGRGTPPPRGSIEYAGVGDMWEPEPSSTGASATATLLSPAYAAWRAWLTWDDWNVWKISWSELDASERWVRAIDRSVRQARTVHGDKILSARDETDWQGFMRRWIPFVGDMKLPGHFNAMLSSNRRVFDDLMNESKRLADRFAKKGMALVPVPYANELLFVMRKVPRKITSGGMAKVLEIGVACGEKMLDENMPWYAWLASSDHRGLRRAIDDAEKAKKIYERSRASKKTFSPGDPAYDEFLRRLTRIWIEAAGLAGIREVQGTARATLADDVRRFPREAGTNLLWALGIAGAAYLGVDWLLHRKKPTVAVPDAFQAGEED